MQFVEGPENTWTIQMEVEDGKMITALQNQAEHWGGNPAQPFEEGFLTWDLNDPVNPKRLSHYRTAVSATASSLESGDRRPALG